jgi:hypothetical protein
MSGMNQATHDYIVFKLAEALKLLVQAKYDTPVQGFKNFDLAIVIVRGCQRTFGDTWEATRDAIRAMPDLVSARKKLLQVNAGDAAPSVAAAIKHVDEIIKALEHHIDVSASKGAIVTGKEPKLGAVGKQRKPRKAPTKRQRTKAKLRAVGKQRKPRKAPTKRKRTGGKRQ